NRGGSSSVFVLDSDVERPRTDNFVEASPVHPNNIRAVRGVAKGVRVVSSLDGDKDSTLVAFLNRTEVPPYSRSVGTQNRGVGRTSGALNSTCTASRLLAVVRLGLPQCRLTGSGYGVPFLSRGKSIPGAVNPNSEVEDGSVLHVGKVVYQRVRVTC